VVLGPESVQVAERDNSSLHTIYPSSPGHPVRRAPSFLASPAVLHSNLPAGTALEGLSPTMGDSWASTMNTVLLPMFQKSSTANNNATGHGSQTVYFAAAKLNDLYGGSGNVPCLESRYILTCNHSTPYYLVIDNARRVNHLCDVAPSRTNKQKRT